MINEDLHQKIKKLPQDYAYLANYLLAQVSKGNKTQTQIFRALMYCLFGSTHLQQDDPKETIHLVNLLKLEEQLGLPVEALVEVEFEHKGKQYTLSRSLKGLKRDSKIQEKTGLVSLTIAYDGNVLKVTKDELEVSQEINNIIYISFLY